MIGYKEIERRLRSLRSKTNLTISLKNETWEFKGLNSPYVSHKRVTLKEGHGVSHLVDFDEGFLFVAPMTWRFEGTVVRSLPAFHIRPLFRFPATVPSWLLPREGKEPIVLVAYPDFFSGYDESGRPKFEGDPDVSINFGDERHILKQSKLTELKSHYDTFKHTIGCQEILINPTLEQFYAPIVRKVIGTNEPFELNFTAEQIEATNAVLMQYGFHIRCAGTDCRVDNDCSLCQYNNMWEIASNDPN